MKQRNPWNWGAPYATQKGTQPEGDQPEHPDGEEGGKAAKASGGDSPKKGRKAKAKKEEVSE